MGNCCSDEVSHAGAHHVGAAAAAAKAASAASAAADRFLRSRGAGASTQIELSLSASNLGDQEYFPKSNPMVVVYSKRRDGALEEIGRSEVILNSLNPFWTTKISVQYQFEVLQPLVFQVFDIHQQFHDVSEKMLKLEEQEFLGEATCLLSEVITKRDRLLTLKLGVSEHNLPNPNKFGELTVQAEESSGSKAIMEMIFRCSDLEIKDLLTKSDTFLLISGISDSGMPVPICKTEVRKNDLNPRWRPVILNLQQIGSKENPLIIECFNFSSNGKHDLVGKIVKSVAELENMYHKKNGENFFVPASNAHECHSKEVLKSQLYVEKYVESNRHTFLDYISVGCQLNFMVGVDFTASNGNPRLPDSLHYIDPSGRPSVYQKVILEVGDVLQYYDPAKRFPAWGFGARPIDGPCSHCFNLNGSTYQPENNLKCCFSKADFDSRLTAIFISRHVPTDAAWAAADSCVRNWLLSTVGDDVLDLAEALDQTAHQLVTGDLSIDAYCQKMKTTADALPDVGHTVIESQLVLNLLRSLNPRFSSTADNIADSNPLPNFATCPRKARPQGASPYQRGPGHLPDHPPRRNSFLRHYLPCVHGQSWRF
ncbi:protein BONZAI 1-like [Miscanthus floridulus]|uniref:protein BONZAI 1-like n=1 Tax=Miscanthus floridulus TaxID=154761 RepID=UPI0034597BB0